MNKAEKVLHMIDESWSWPADNQLWKNRTQSRRDIRSLINDINKELANFDLPLLPPDEEINAYGGDWKEYDSVVI